MQANNRTRRAGRYLYRLCLVDGILDPGRVRLVARHLASSTRRGALPILAHFKRLVQLDTDRHSAVVESATPLVDGLRASIRGDLARRYGPAIETTFRENPALIAGLRVKVGSDVYDGSVRARLDTLEARI
jgi:F-type H+-transporting ATPase subunit delta